MQYLIEAAGDETVITLVNNSAALLSFRSEFGGYSTIRLLSDCHGSAEDARKLVRIALSLSPQGLRFCSAVVRGIWPLVLREEGFSADGLSYTWPPT